MKKILLITTIFFCFVLTSCGSHKVDLLEYVDIEFSGSEGIGVAEINLDETRLKLNLQNNSKDLNEAVLDTIVNSITFSLDKEKELSNEDSVIATLKWNDELANDYGFNFSGESKNFIVSDLQERIVADFFEDIEIILEGVSPKSKVLIQNNSSDSKIKNVTYSAQPSSMIANGDTITITANYSKNDFSEDEYIIEDNKKDFVVDGADEYIKTFDSIDDDAIEKLKSQAEDILTTRFSKLSTYTYAIHNTYVTAKFDEDSIELISRPIIDSYFSSYKDGLSNSYVSEYNMIYLVFEMTVIDFKLDEPKTIYPVVTCKNFIQRSSGETYFELSNVSYYKNFNDIATLEANIIDANKAKYDFENITL